MTATMLLRTVDVVTLLALVAVLAVRTGLVERAAGTRSGTFTARVVIRRLDVAAGLLTAVCVTALVTTVVAGVFAWT